MICPKKCGRNKKYLKLRIKIRILAQNLDNYIHDLKKKCTKEKKCT